jgi:hypothetical protein
MTKRPVTDTVKTARLASRWYAHRLGHDTLPGVVGLCHHGMVQRQELDSCRSALESSTGQRSLALASPFGSPRPDYTGETGPIAADLGFTAGFTTRGDFARAGERPLERSRFVVLAAVTAAELAHRITYAWPR